MVDKEFCMSSYLAFRYIEKDNVDFYPFTHHRNSKLLPEKERIAVYTANDIDSQIAKQIDSLKNKKLGILLSGGMDSAILASYMKNCAAYTFRFSDSDFQREELKRAEYYAETNNMNLHYVDIDWNIVEDSIDKLMQSKGAPVHSIEPQIYRGAVQALNDGIELMIIGDGSDYIFGGMDKLLSKDWNFEEFITRYCYINPEDVLIHPSDIRYLFEKYRIGKNNIDFIAFLDIISTEESFNSYFNAFKVAEMPYYDPYAILKMGNKLDLERIRNGEPKYLIQELFKMRYPNVEPPQKIPMPRPVDKYFQKWQGPKRKEFKPNLDMSRFTGNQKWQLWCLERFLNLYEPTT